MQDRSRFNYIGNRPKPTTPAPAVGEKPKKTTTVFWKRWWFIAPIAIAVLLTVGWLVYGYLDTRAELKKLSSTSSNQQEMLQAISRHLAVPDEEPTVATVNDATKLNNQEFFKHSQDGDKVFIFPKANRALIYRPSEQKVIEYSKINIDSLQGQDQPSNL